MNKKKETCDCNRNINLDIQGVSKCLDESLGVSFPHLKKKVNFNIHMRSYFSRDSIQFTRPQSFRFLFSGTFKNLSVFVPIENKDTT